MKDTLPVAKKGKMMDDDSEYFFWHPILRLTKPCKEPLAIDFGDSTSTSNLVVWAAHFFF
jgi:hypothetical protein